MWDNQCMWSQLHHSCISSRTADHIWRGQGLFAGTTPWGRTLFINQGRCRLEWKYILSVVGCPPYLQWLLSSRRCLRNWKKSSWSRTFKSWSRSKLIFVTKKSVNRIFRITSGLSTCDHKHCNRNNETISKVASKRHVGYSISNWKILIIFFGCIFCPWQFGSKYFMLWCHCKVNIITIVVICINISYFTLVSCYWVASFYTIRTAFFVYFMACGLPEASCLPSFEWAFATVILCVWRFSQKEQPYGLLSLEAWSNHDVPISLLQSTGSQVTMHDGTWYNTHSSYYLYSCFRKKEEEVWKRKPFEWDSGGQSCVSISGLLACRHLLFFESYYSEWLSHWGHCAQFSQLRATA